MSLSFLKSLNGKKQGFFHQWLNSLESNPRIAWYPSAGTDFRPLLYLSRTFSKAHPPVCQEPELPEIFLFTDYFPYDSSTFLDTNLIYNDGRTSVEVVQIEELDRCDLPLYRQITTHYRRSRATNRVVFMTVRVASIELRMDYIVPVLYSFNLNESTMEQMVEHQASISHVIHVRYGGGRGGGGRATGVWLTHALNLLNCEVFITDDHYQWAEGDIWFYNRCEALPRERCTGLKPIRTIPGREWSNHGDVTWYLNPNQVKN